MKYSLGSLAKYIVPFDKLFTLEFSFSTTCAHSALVRGLGAIALAYKSPLIISSRITGMPNLMMAYLEAIKTSAGLAAITL